MIIEKKIKFLVAIALLYVVAHIFLLHNCRDYIAPYGDMIDIFLYNLSLSLIASFVFYYIVVYLKEKRDKENIDKIISSQLEYIIKLFEDQKGRKGEVNLSDCIEIKEAIKSILPLASFLDTELLKILFEILNSKYMIKNTDIHTAGCKRDFFFYSKAMESLNEYYIIKIKDKT